MAGFNFSKGALSGASLSDKLFALGSALDGDMASVQAIRDRHERDKLASALAAELQAQRSLPQPQAEAPQPPSPHPDPIGATSADVVDRLRQSGGLLSAPPVGGLHPDAVNPSLPMLDASQPQRGLYDRMLPMLLQAAGKGMDISGLASLVRNEDYVRALPQKDQAAARLDPARYADWQHEDGLPLIGERSPGSVVTSTDRRTGATLPMFETPNRPDPVTTDRVIGAVVAKKSRGEELTPDEQAIFRRWQAGSDGFYGERPPQRPAKPPSPRQAIEAKVAAGQPLTAGEQTLWEVMQRNPFAGLLGANGDGDPTGDEGQTPQPPSKPARPAAPPAARNLPQKPAPAAAPQKVGTALNPAQPRSRAEAAALPAGTWFRDPSGNLIQKR